MFLIKINLGKKIKRSLLNVLVENFGMLFRFCKDTDEISNEEPLQYDFDTISLATNNFSDANKLGQGGFGVVYRGRLPNRQEIAVKRLSNDSRQGELEFKNEVMLVAKLQHRNLVRLLGFCLEGTERILIYEFVTNSSLDNFIFEMGSSLVDVFRMVALMLSEMGSSLVDVFRMMAVTTYNTSLPYAERYRNGHYLST
ncbi:hypothetical protein TEA_013810 [Camellia sinensis var. sinensis]|uniref:Protein kinase domain-containing protein n=1 Tax=Camellia sinensis var. sinensis TaxID=542762 RepID=A0A4S4DGK2_CAMSN|nr:hypothetical protein TEA_013810 [Camellia sinensis var. sinensis]